MGEVVTIYHETPLEFVARNGPTLTNEVAFRFSWYVADALRTMKALEAEGKVKSRRVSFDVGAGYEWTVLR